MSIKVVTYGGHIGWFLRKHFSIITSGAYLETQYILRKRLFERYIEYFKNAEVIEQPCLISIETINRCNSTCDFCPANRNSECRPYMKMDDELFEKIIGDLHSWNYSGYLNLYVNNEPLIDNKIEEKYTYAKKMLPNAKMLLYTNGTLLSIERFEKLAGVVDKMIINNYSENLTLHNNIREIYEYAKNDKVLKDKDITIQVRYIHEILTNRAGSAPNKKKKRKQHKICIMPYTDITIYPNGVCGLCCSDVLEKTYLGDASKASLREIWNDQSYWKARDIIGTDRENWPFCKGCDFVDAGIRNEFLKSKLNQRK